ncbi:hypothetical protein VTJ49DRAFT_1497 [Mycothermus thermophilus]|uniref:Coiled-coil domain-containing protein 130 n=1 Tax=Humicola insolens TaxID=85995 RepID=A0ABR3VC96_HUMIN
MQGFNMGRYRPPDADEPGGFSRPKRRAITASAPVVRFEMPFAIWCAHCPKPTLIGQGVRFNAEKLRAGAYHSTPIWSFRLRHADCGGEIEMRTDPARADFVIVSGARRRDYGGADAEDEDGSLVASLGAVAPIPTPRERDEQRETAFGRLEKTIADRERLLSASQRIAELQEEGARRWEDPYSQNQRLRKAFRAGRHAREREAARAEDIKARLGGIGIDLLPETEEDARRARLVEFGSVVDTAGGEDGDGKGDADPVRDVRLNKTLAKPLFEPSRSNGGTGDKKGDGKATPRRLKSEIKAARMRENLVAEIISNTRAAKDPFLDFGNGSKKDRPLLAGLKRKRALEEAPDPPRPSSAPPTSIAEEDNGTPSSKGTAGTTPLVDYASDSD